jgi:hypothetical protein
MMTMKTEPDTPSEYREFKNLLAAVLTVPHSEIVRREAEYKRQAALNPHKRGPKPKRRRRAASRALPEAPRV